MRRILAPQTRRATSFHTYCSHLPGDPPKGLQNDGIGGFGMRTRLWRAAEGGSRAPTRPLDRSNLNFDDRETFFGTGPGHPHSTAVVQVPAAEGAARLSRARSGRSRAVRTSPWREGEPQCFARRRP